jgi:TubC N-terminal docking domain
MTPEAFFSHLLRCNATIQVVGEKIRVEAPNGVLTPELRAALVTHKPDPSSLAHWSIDAIRARRLSHHLSPSVRLDRHQRAQ